MLPNSVGNKLRKSDWNPSIHSLGSICSQIHELVKPSLLRISGDRCVTPKRTAKYICGGSYIPRYEKYISLNILLIGGKQLFSITESRMNRKADSTSNEERAEKKKER